MAVILRPTERQRERNAGVHARRKAAAKRTTWATMPRRMLTRMALKREGVRIFKP